MIAPTITYWPNLRDTAGNEWRAPDWGAVLDRLSKPREFAGDMDHPGWSPVRFDPCQRDGANVQEVFALCLDFDGGTTIEGALEKFAPFYGLLHTTRKHTAEAHRFRVVLPLSRALSAFEYAELWKRVASFAGQVDTSTRDPSRFWFLAGTKPGGEFRAERLAGAAPLNVNEWLAKPDPTVAPPREIPRTADPSHIERRAIAYIARMPDAIAGQHGHDATWQVACALACGFDLSEETTFQILWSEYNGRCSPAWSEKELRHKARHARNNSRLGRGYLIGEQREWTPAQRVTPAPVAAREPGDDAEEPYETGPDPGYQETATETVATKPINERFPLFTERELIKQVFDHVISDAPKQGFTTGVREIDVMLCGIRPGMVACVGAQTSWGKSTFATMVLEENLPLGVKVLVVSNEDQPLLYGRRIVCRRGALNALSVRDGELDPQDVARIAAIGSAASNQHVLLDATGMPAEVVAEAIRACRSELGTQLVIVDYLQRIRMRATMQDRRNEVSRAAELIGDAIKMPIEGRERGAGIVFSQLKRLQDKAPDTESMKESGDIENMAEHIILGWRKVRESMQGEENVQRFYNIPKNKDGPVSVDWQELEFNQITASFTGHIIRANRPEAVRQFDDFGDRRYP